ncbi:MAG: S41 family peptidase [Bacteroides sp.]|nr:S41 family peptidase [Bacteroides sp.]
MSENLLKVLSLLLVMIALAATMNACGKSDDPDPDPGPEPGLSQEELLNQKVNTFTVESMKKLYVWNKEIPSTVDSKSTEDPKTLFEKICRRYNVNQDNWIDRWSSLKNNAEDTRASMDDVDVEKGFGYGLSFYIDEQNHIFAVVMYVTPDSPAAQAGLVRGDIIHKMNGNYMTTNNYTDLYYGTSFKVSTVYFQLIPGTNNYAAVETGKEYTLQAVSKSFDPFVAQKVITRGTKKIGYLCYTRFVDINSKTNNQLTAGAQERKQRMISVFQNFKNQGITDLILDLRYNPGGYAETSRYLSSILAPSSVLNGKTVFLKELWNEEFTKTLSEDERTQYFEKNVAVNLNLNNVYMLTTGSTASASEATLIGLMPYMNVHQIGETTHGKYCGAISVSPEYYYHDLLNQPKTDIQEIKDWEIEMMIFRFANNNGYTDFVNGIEPDHKIAETRNYWLKPLGDENDPLVAEALNLISGIATKSVPQTTTIPGFERLSGPESVSGGMIKQKHEFSTGTDYK